MSTTVETIQKRLSAMPAAMAAKGLREPSASFDIKGNETTKGWLTWKDEKRSYGSAYEWFKDGGPTEILDAMDAHIGALPSAEETRRADFMSALGAVIELGRDTGIDVDFVNPLVATMKRLSENVITDQREAA